MRTFLIGLFLASAALGYPLIPKVSHTPGENCVESDSDFSEYRYPEKIVYCERNVSTSLKRRIYEDYGIPEADRKNYTIDHLVPLSIGGDNHQGNLWPEHKDVKAMRPKLEYDLYLLLKAAKVTQSDAIETVLCAKFHPKEASEMCDLP